MDSEAEATIVKSYYKFQNNLRIKPKIIPKKNNIIKTKDGIVASRPKDYNYIDKYYIPNDKIKLPVIKEPEITINYEDIDPLVILYYNSIRNGGCRRDYRENPIGFSHV